MRKLKFDIIGTGGNMEALEALRRGHQILISDAFGNIPKQGEDYCIGIYKRDGSGDCSDEPVLIWEGKKFNLDKAENKARSLLSKLVL